MGAIGNSGANRRAEHTTPSCWIGRGEVASTARDVEVMINEELSGASVDFVHTTVRQERERDMVPPGTLPCSQVVQPPTLHQLGYPRLSARHSAHHRQGRVPHPLLPWVCHHARGRRLVDPGGQRMAPKHGDVPCKRTSVPVAPAASQLLAYAGQ